MIKAIVSDFSRVLLFHIDDAFPGRLNELNNELLAENPDYSFWEHFKLNQVLLEYYRTLNNSVPVFVFTSETIQEHPAVKKEIDGAFSGVLSALRFGLKKSDPAVYQALADHIQVPIGEILFVDDLPDNIATARTAGMQTLQFESNQSTIDYLKTALSL